MLRLAFLRLHAQGIIACDFLVAVTPHPNSAWTQQQLRGAAEFEERYECLPDDRDSIFAERVDESVQRLGMTVSKPPPHASKANAINERVIGTMRRECLEWLIRRSESHLRLILKSWVLHYNAGRPPVGN